MQYMTKTSEETKQLGRKVGESLRGGEVLCFYGNLGAGKTTFLTGLIPYFTGKKRILSPTFIIVRHYSAAHAAIKNIYHIDLYRLEKSEELTHVGLNEFIHKPDTIVAIEWAERLGELLPKKRVDLRFEILENDERIITIDTI